MAELFEVLLLVFGLVLKSEGEVSTTDRSRLAAERFMRSWRGCTRVV